mgnify:CR=1 FL=1
MEFDLLREMINIGRWGFWSKERQIEEKIFQCKKILSEFEEEKNQLEYLIEHHRLFSMELE